MLYWIESDDLSVLALSLRQGNGQERQRQRGKQGRKQAESTAPRTVRDAPVFI